MLQKFMKSRQGNEQTTEKREDIRSNMTRQNNKRADRKLESNDSLMRFQTGGDIRNPRPPFGAG